MAKNLNYGKPSREWIMKGVDFLCDAVKVTLGVKGRNVAIGRRLLGRSPLVTKDGVTVANSVDPKDARMQIGSDLAREASNRAVYATGDGTTTATVLVQAMVKAGFNFIDRGIDPWSVKRGIDKAVPLIVEQLEKMARKISGPSETFDIANISSNYDKDAAEKVCEAFKAVGTDGAVVVEESGTILTDVKVTSGIQFRSGDFMSPVFVNDPERFACVHQDPFILCYEGRIGTAKSLVPILSAVRKTGKPLLIIAGDWEQDALGVMVVNAAKGAPLVAVRSGQVVGRRRDLLCDIAALTGGTAILDDSGMKIESVTLEHLGQAKRIEVDDQYTTVVEGYGKVESVQSRVTEIRTKLETSEDKIWLQRRLAQLTGGIALIRVGGNTETEMRERKDRFDDAVGATRAAIEKGYVPGGGLALLKAQQQVSAAFKGDEQVGLTVVSQACAEPLKQIAENAGTKGEEILHRVVTSPSYPDLDQSMGFNAATGEISDLVKDGVIDPVKVVIEALRSAAATAGMILTTECIVTEPEEELQAAIDAARRV